VWLEEGSLYKEILIMRDSREGRAAVVEDGALTEILIAREERQVGSIFKARVANVLPGMNAAFVDIGSDRNAFLCADDAAAHLGEEANERFSKVNIRDLLRVNEETLVQVVKEAVGTKGARVTTFVTLPGRNLVLIPNANYIGVSRRVESEAERQRLRQLAEKMRPEGMGLIIRTAAGGRPQEELQAEVDYLASNWEKIQRTAKKKRAPAIIHQELALVDQVLRDVLTPDFDRILIDDAEEHSKVVEMLENTYPALAQKVHLYNDRKPLFEFHGIDAEVDKALKRKVWLQSGGYLVIDHTEALWVVDVNTGKYTGKNNSLADTILKTNLEACVEICRQLRLRDMGGIIIIDFIDMESHADRRKVLVCLNEELKKDRTRTHLIGMTELGLVQLTRKREGKDLDLVLRTSCSHCNGVGRVFSPQSLAVKVHRDVLKMAQETRSEAILVRLHPRTAMALVGTGGELLERLESQAGRPVLVQARPLFHVEHYELKGGRANELRDRLRQVHKGQKVRVTLEEGVGGESALAVVDGNLVEVINGADRVGQEVEIRLIDIDKIVKRAEVFR
jgi:ribonuclease G